MLKARSILALVAGAGLIFAVASAADAAPVTPQTCTGGAINSGTYASITVTGNCHVTPGAYVTVLGNVIVAPHGSFDAESFGATLHVKGNVIGSVGSFVGLGCTEAHPCDYGNIVIDSAKTALAGAQSAPAFASITIDGNVVLSGVFDAALDGILVKGNVVSAGGGAGVSPDPFIPFPVKDNEIRGNLSVSGSHTAWFGVIRNTIYNNVVITGNRSLNPDSNEVVDNWVGGNLMCAGNSPQAQVGDSYGGPNYVRGVATGECASLTGPTRL